MRDVRRGRGIGEEGSAGVQWQARPRRTIPRETSGSTVVVSRIQATATAVYNLRASYTSATIAHLHTGPRISPGAIRPASAPAISSALPQQCRCQTCPLMYPSTTLTRIQNGEPLPFALPSTDGLIRAGMISFASTALFPKSLPRRRL